MKWNIGDTYMDTQNITIQNQMQPKDYKKFLVIDTFRIRWLYTLLSNSAGALIVALLIRNVMKYDLALTLLCFLGVLVLLLGIQYVFIQLQCHLARKKDHLHQFDIAQTMKFEDDQVVVTADGWNWTGKIPYESLIRVVESSDAFYLYRSIKTASLISKREINPDESAEISDLLKNKMGKYYMSI
jgi:hypothetical protein